ncbi:MAG: ABC transporter ATP-binding protein [Lautropia sp.]|nr:ABC transporter ATP-binding protein [Lautropia sp.]
MTQNVNQASTSREDKPLRRVWRRFRPYLKGQGMMIVGSLAALLIMTLMRLAEPWPLAFVVDHVLEKSRSGDANLPLGLQMMELVWLSAAGVIVFAALRALGGYLSTIGFARIGASVLSRVRNDLYSKLLHLSLAFHQKQRAGDLTLRLVNDVAMLKEVTVSALLPMLANVFILGGIMLMMFWLNWELALYSLIPLPIMWLSARRSSRLIHEASRYQRKREGALASTASETMSAIRTVQSLALEGDFDRTFRGSEGKAMTADLRTKRLSAGLERSVDLLVAVAVALVLWQGAIQVIEGALTAGDLLVFISYLKNSMRPVREYAKYAARLSKALASGERIADILEEPNDIVDLPNAKPAPAFRGEVNFRNLHFAYDPVNGPAVFSGLNLDLKAGEHVAIVGPSGMGKSTLASLLLRLYEPQKGTVEIDGRSIRDWTMASVRAQIGLLPQDTLLFAGSIRDNLTSAAGREVSDKEVELAACMANAHDFIMEQPHGYDTVIGERGATLSGGQRQRIAIARVALRRCPILVLDEPTTGLDRQSEAIVRRAIQRLIANRTTLIITHDLDLAASADRIVYLEKGRIAETGTHAELLAKDGPYAALWESHRQAVSTTMDSSL